MTVAHWNRLHVLAVGWLVLACGGNGGGGTGPCSPGSATQLTKGGDQQQWYFSNPLPTPYSVTARDASGCAVPGIVVNWAAAPGSGSVDPPQSTTNGSGVATSTHTLAASGTTQTVTATPIAAGLQPVTFTASASAPPTTADVTVRDNSFDPAGVVIKMSGTVTWTWAGTVRNTHNVTLSGPTPRPADLTNRNSGSGQGTFNTVGEYRYSCTNHAGMNGTVTVVN